LGLADSFGKYTVTFGLFADEFAIAVIENPGSLLILLDIGAIRDPRRLGQINKPVAW